MATIRNVSKHVKVSIATVLMVLSGNEFYKVSELTCKRMFEAENEVESTPPI